MKKGLKIVMWIVLSLVGLIIIGMLIFSNSQIFKNLKIGFTMDKFTEITTNWADIDFTTVIEGETPYIESMNNKPYPALEKYRISGIYGIKEILFICGSDENDVENNLDADSFENISKFTQAYLFRSTDNGKTFEKISLGHGIVEYVSGGPIFISNTLYAQVYEQDTKEVRYYRSSDLGKTWILNDWKPTTVWNDETMFIEKNPPPYDDNAIKTATISQDNGKTWHPLSGVLKEFYNDTHSLQQLNDATVVGMTDNKEFLFLDLKTMKIEKKIFETPENKKILRFAISNHQLGLELEEYTLNDGRDTQTSYYFPETKEYVNLPKQLPYVIYWDIKDNYIGGFFNYGDEVFGVPVHVYTLDRGKHWKYEILDKYNLMTASAYVNGQLWFVASKDSAGGVFLSKGKIE